MAIGKRGPGGWRRRLVTGKVVGSNPRANTGWGRGKSAGVGSLNKNLKPL